MASIHWKIYLLIDPTSGEPRYVGKTVVPLRRRLKKHITECLAGKEGHTYKNRWLKKVLDAGKVPKIELIREGLGEGWVEAEIEEIARYREIYKERLTNATAGGEGMEVGHVMKEETRLKIAEKHRGRRCSPETREKMSRAKRGVPIRKPRTPEHLRKISEALLGKHHSEEWKKSHSVKMKGKPKNPKYWDSVLTRRAVKWAEKARLAGVSVEALPGYFVTGPIIDQALIDNSGDVKRVAELLQVPTRTIRSRIQGVNRVRYNGKEEPTDAQ